MPPDVARLHRQIDQCPRADQPGLRKRLRGLSRRAKAGQPVDQGLERLTAEIAAGELKLQNRRDQLPVPSYPAELPVVERREAILAAIRDNQVVILCGETGSGKTTQLPKMCLELGRGVQGLIGHTQPRRIAARSVAARIASELQSEVGEAVGFKVRFADQLSPRSYIKLMTDGILLAEIQSDPQLNAYDTIIVDEAHERSLNIDFLLGYLKRLLPKRRDLKLIITSATIDPERFAKHFDDAPIVFAEGRTYPVETRYRPMIGDEDERDLRTDEALCAACEELAADGGGDLLVFLPGEREIREHADALAKHCQHSKRLRGTEVLPLYGRLSSAEQQRCFAEHGRRRIVLATNVAETSLTVPGIRYVVDFGTARLSRYSVRSKVQRLPIEKISQASADQRKGRCGREAPGICIRLYDEDDFAARAEFTEPEILRTNLAAVILQMESMNLGHVDDFPFVEPPEAKFVNDGYRLLQELGAVDDKRKLTRLGRQLGRLPIDPTLARMLVAADAEGSLEEVLTIVAALATQDPRERPMDARQAADEAHADFNDERSDFIALGNVWAFWCVQRERLSQNQLRKMCRQRFLSYVRLREWSDTRRQLAEMCKSLGLKRRENAADQQADYGQIHRALLAGLLGNVCVKDDPKDKKGAYLGTRNRQVHIFPGSGLFKRGPKWMMAAEVTETSRLYARGVAAIEPEWIARLADHLLKRSYSEPHWQKRRAQVGAKEKASLYGLPIYADKRVNYGPLDPDTSREIFIREALVEGHYASDAAFFVRNRELLAEVAELEDKSRRRDILVAPQELEHFYQQIIPQGIYSGPLFEKWRAQFERDAPKGLFLSRELLLMRDAEDVTTAAYPDQLDVGGVVLPLSYHFRPGAADDGVTLNVPAAVINQIDARRCEYLVPGLLAEKCTALIKSLPKSLRRNFVPAPDFAKAAAASIEPAARPLSEALGAQLQRMAGQPVPAEAWDESALPEHLRMRYRIVDGHGAELGVGRNLAALRGRFLGHVEERLAQTSSDSIERDDLRDWNFGDLPETVEIESAGVALQGYPALAAEDGQVALRVFATREQAEREMDAGLRLLYRKVLADQAKYLSRKLPGLERMALLFAPFGSKQQLLADLVDATFEQTFIEGRELPRRRESFLAALNEGMPLLIDKGNRIADTVFAVLDGNRALAKRLSGSISLAWVEPSMDIKDQLAGLIHPGFVTETPGRWLARIPVYLQAIGRRLDGLDKSPERDRKLRAEMLPLWEAFKGLPRGVQKGGEYQRDWTELRWHFEELRVSAFAQELGAVVKVSLPRLEKKLQALKAGARGGEAR